MPTKLEKLKAFVPIEKATDLGDGVVETTVATESVDRDGERLLIKGVNVKNFEKNPVVLLHHNYQDFPIGQALKVTKTKDGRLTAKVQFAINEYDKAHTAYKLVKGGYLRAVSIGFIPKEVEDNQFTESEMLEFSFVTVPANPEALVEAKSKGVVTDEELKSLDEDEAPEDEAQEPKETKSDIDFKRLELGADMLRAAADRFEKAIDDLNKMGTVGVAKNRKVRRSIRVKLATARSASQFAQSVSQSLNRELKGAVKPKRVKRLKVKIKENRDV